MLICLLVAHFRLHLNNFAQFSANALPFVLPFCVCFSLPLCRSCALYLGMPLSVYIFLPLSTSVIFIIVTLCNSNATLPCVKKRQHTGKRNRSKQQKKLFK